MMGNIGWWRRGALLHHDTEFHTQEHAGLIQRLSLFRWAADRLHPAATPESFWRRAKFLLRAMLAPRLSASWILSVMDGPLRRVALQAPRLFEKPQRLYLNRHWRVGQRHAVLRQHYDWLCRAFSPAQIDLLHRGAGLAVAVIETDTKEVLTVVLRHDAGFEREGELTLSLKWADRIIVSLAFSVAQDALGRRQLLIGCLQSRKSDAALDDARQLTHALHGLRPKALLTIVAQGIAAASGMARVLAITDDAHVFQGMRYLLKRRVLRRHQVAFGYDAFWSSCGGEVRPDGFFELLTQSVRRDPALIKSSKRAQYRRRYALLDGIEQQVRALPVNWADGAVIAAPLLQELTLATAATGRFTENA